MKIWCVLRLPLELRFVVPILERLAGQGADLVLSFAGAAQSDSESRSSLEWALERVPSLRHEPLDLSESRVGALVARTALPARDLRDYVERSGSWPAALRRRWHQFLSRRSRRLVAGLERRGLGRLVLNRGVAGALRLVERAYPPPRGVARQLKEIRPDLVFLTPLIYPQSRETDVLKAARRAGVPTVGLVLSWDNLTSKGSFHVLPDRLLVWNETQLREARELHAVDDGVLEVVGAPVFDYMFLDASREEREPFLARFGVDAGKRYVLYAVSSSAGLGPGSEVAVVERLVAELVRILGDDAPQLLVRPHPKNREGFAPLRERSNVLVWPVPAFPHTEPSRAELYNSVLHADAVVGLSTSLFLEAAVLDCPCVSILHPSVEPGGVAPATFTHFSYLLEGGFLTAVDDEVEAAEAIGHIVRGGDDGHRRDRAAFVESFLRPHGSERPAAEVAAERILAVVER